MLIDYVWDFLVRVIRIAAIRSVTAIDMPMNNSQTEPMKLMGVVDSEDGFPVGLVDSGTGDRFIVTMCALWW